MLIYITEPSEIDCDKLMAIYRESNGANAKIFFPQIKNAAKARKKAETAYCDYIEKEFLSGKNAYCILEENGAWVSALRLYKIDGGFYFIEALETAPKFRCKGYAEKLLNELIEKLKNTENCKIYDCVSKKNTASLRVHEKCGFKIVDENAFDYLQQKIDEQSYGFEYSV